MTDNEGGFWKSMFRGKKTTTTLLGGEGEVGHVTYGQDRLSPQTAYLQDLFVHPDFRKRGKGKQLVIEALRLAAQNGHQFAEVEIESTNSASLSLVEGLGFSVIGQVRSKDNKKTYLRLRRHTQI